MQILKNEHFKGTLTIEIRTLVAWLKPILLPKIESQAKKHIFLWKQNVYKQSEMQHHFGLKGKILMGKGKKCWN